MNEGGTTRSRRILGRRIDGLEEGKAMEIGIPRIDHFDPVFAHQHRRLRVVDEVAVQKSRLSDDIGRDSGVTIRGNEQVE